MIRDLLAKAAEVADPRARYVTQARDLAARLETQRDISAELHARACHAERLVVAVTPLVRTLHDTAAAIAGCRGDDCTTTVWLRAADAITKETQP